MTRAELLRTLASVPGGFLLDQTLIDYAAFFLRQPSRPNPARPVAKSGSAPGSGSPTPPGLYGHSEQRTRWFSEQFQRSPNV